MSDFRTEIAGVSITELARQFGTPTFVYDAAMIRRRIADLAAFDMVRYAQKACSNLAILDLVRRSGALVDAVSAAKSAAPWRPASPPPAIPRRSSTPPTCSTRPRSIFASSRASTSTAARLT